MTLMLQDETLASALRQIDHAQQERRIIFVLNDLDSIRVTCNIIRRPVIDAVKEVCEGYPILITECDADILVEYIRPPIRLLPNTIITRRQLRYDADGYSFRPNHPGMTAHQLLLLLPNLTAQDDGLCLNGQDVQAYYLNGERLANADELLKLPSELIAEVRVNFRTHSIYVTLLSPPDRGYYGSVSAEADFYRSSAEGSLGLLWFCRYGKTSIYNRLDAALDDVWHNIHQKGLMTQPTAGCDMQLSSTVQDSRLQTNEQSFSNRISITREVAKHRTVGLSYFIASHRGKANVRRDDATGFIDFSGSNRHIDQELTLRYTATLGQHDTRLEAVVDYYSRQTASENISLYGAGVGTEIGEAPSISMWKAAVEVHHPVSRHVALYGSSDVRYLFSHYDPRLYLSNFEGSPVLLHEMNQHGLMQKHNVGISTRWQQLRLESGLALQHHKSVQRVQRLSQASDGVNDYDYTQAGLYPYLQLHYPIDQSGRHQLNLSWQRDLEDLPYAAMSPAVRWSDAFNYRVGNHQLHAPEVERWMLNASCCDARYSLTASYLRLHDEIFWQSAISSGQTDIYYTQPINLPASRLWIFQAEANLHPTTYWQLKLDALWQLRPEDATISGQHYQSRHWQQQYSCNNMITWGRGWKLSLNAYYHAAYHHYDRTYHNRHSLQGELLKGFMTERLQCALTFRIWGSDRQLVRQIGPSLVSYRYQAADPHLGLRAVFKLDGGRTVKTGHIEGAQHYDDIKDY